MAVARSREPLAGTSNKSSGIWFDRTTARCPSSPTLETLEGSAPRLPEEASMRDKNPFGILPAGGRLAGIDYFPNHLGQSAAKQKGPSPQEKRVDIMIPRHHAEQAIRAAQG
jgi:hypothetical protein